LSSLGQSPAETIAILDFGSQYSQLIARRVRECGVYCQLFSHRAAVQDVEALEPVGFILSGSPFSVYSEEAPCLPSYVLDSGRPVLGICYGMQLLAQTLGGRVQRSDLREYGPAELIVLQSHNPLFDGLPDRLEVWMSHGDTVESCPRGFEVLARTDTTAVAACADANRRIYGLQFHPEVVHTPLGTDLLRNFLYSICGCRGTWEPAAFVASAVADIAKQVGSGSAVCGLSGGVDSTVAATLAQRAIGDRLTCVFVNHGLLRLNEAEDSLRIFRDSLGLQVVYVDGTKRFLCQLQGVVDPEAKRRVIGHEFVRVFEEQAAKLGDAAFLVQGTLYPDVIESNAADTRTAVRIKTHHNVGGLPEDMSFELVEPLRYLFKDEVRRVARELRLPDAIVSRQPFPGPGLAVRIIGEITEERLACLRAADHIVTSEVEAAGLGKEVWQYFAVLTPVRTVGVMGDGRTYELVVAVRAVVSEDGMTADWARLPFDVLARISSRIVNTVPGVNRVVYDVTCKPPSTIEWE
jgi:GMP synthase (glutamine-hydrolysing)